MYEGSEVVSWKRWEGSEVANWESGKAGDSWSYSRVGDAG